MKMKFSVNIFSYKFFFVVVLLNLFTFIYFYNIIIRIAELRHLKLNIELMLTKIIIEDLEQ